MKVRVKVQPTGLLNGEPWPPAGEVIDLPDAVAEGMVAAGALEAVKDKPAKKAAEKRPASQAGVEKRTEKKA